MEHPRHPAPYADWMTREATYLDAASSYSSRRCILNGTTLQSKQIRNGMYAVEGETGMVMDAGPNKTSQTTPLIHACPRGCNPRLRQPNG
jgi:hypothetical protein